MTSSDTDQQAPNAPADRLRQAAGVVREASAAATPGVWTAHLLPPNEHYKHPGHWVKTKYEDGAFVNSLVVADCPWRQADATWIALMGPAVGEALAKWLERAAEAGDDALHDLHADYPDDDPDEEPECMDDCGACADEAAALAVADAILAAVTK